jgi:hypothetical protein
LLQDVDKLRHGPDFELSEVDIFDGRKERPQYMVSRDIVQVVRHIVANPALKDDMTYSPVRIWTSPEKQVRSYGEANAGDWWWNQQVSNYDCA